MASVYSMFYSMFQHSLRNCTSLRYGIGFHRRRKMLVNIYTLLVSLYLMFKVLTYIPSLSCILKLEFLQMASIYSTLTYWLVKHPTIANFTWTEGETLGSTVFFVLVVVFGYLTATFLLRSAMRSLPSVGPRILKPITALHSLILCLLSLIMAVGGILSITSDPKVRFFHVICFPLHVKPTGPLFFWAQVFYLSKILEFVDTLLIILGKSFHRLSFLHVYHHATVLVMCFVWFRTRQSMFPLGLILNSMVHVIMYGYYFLCALGSRPKWKRLVTYCQIVQFLLGFVLSVLMLPEHFFGSGCSGMWGLYFNGAFNVSLLVLFFNFLYQNYIKKTRPLGEKSD